MSRGPGVRALTIGIAGFLALPAPLAAQATAPSDSVALARIAAHLDAARFDSARAGLVQWQQTRAPSARESARASADMLAARLERDGVAAQHKWLGLALAHPFSPDAGLALLRVGQAAVLQGDIAAAIVYLTRLIDDFPGSGQQAEALLWLSRAHFVAGSGTRACDAARTGLAIGASAEVQGLLRLQEERGCALGDPASPAASTPADRAVGPWAVQSGAFRMRAGADALVARLRRAGFQPRLVRVPGNDLMRVRVGSFTGQSEAAALRDRLRSGGFDAVVVEDASRETTVP